MDNNDNIEFPPVINTQFSQIFIPVKGKASPIITTLATFFIHWIFHFLILDLSLMTYQKYNLYTNRFVLVKIYTCISH